MNSQQQPMSQYDPELIKRLKKEIANDLKVRQERREGYYRDIEEVGSNEMNNDRRRFSPMVSDGIRAGRAYGQRPFPRARANWRNYVPDYDWWLERQEYDYQRDMLLLRDELQQELRTLQQMNQRTGQVQDPRIRHLVHELLQETAQQGMDIPDLMQSVNIKQGISASNPLLDRILGPIKGLDKNSFLWGVGAALVGVAIVPSMAKTLRPFARKAIEEAMDITERTEGMFARVKEEFEDIVAEASFNKMKSGMAEEVIPTKD